MTTKLFSTTPDYDYLEFYQDKKPQYNRIVKFLDFKQEDISLATGVPKSSVRYDDKMPTELSERICEWATLLNLVAGHFKGDLLKTDQWFTTPNPLLGDMRPRDMIRVGRYKKLFKFVLNALAENQR